MKPDKIIITGPESTGKTTLAEAIAKKLNLQLIPEFARNYMQSLNRKYTFEDVMYIGLQQIETIYVSHSQSPIICDTDLLTTIIWLEDKFNYTEPAFNDLWRKKSNDIFFLCPPDFAWQYDPLREDEDRREILYKKYLHYLTVFEKKYFEITGDEIQREQYAINEIIANLDVL